jgi:hypothetical protein
MLTVRFVFAFSSILLLAASGCATTSDCQRQTEDCLERCEATTDNRDVARKSLPPVTTLTECESRCGCPREGTTPKPPQGPPTPTGN